MVKHPRHMRSMTTLPIIVLMFIFSFAVLGPYRVSAQSGHCVNSRGETVGEGSRDGSFVRRSGSWIYSPP